MARNAAATIERSVRSALGECHEVVLVDDCSTDGTGQLAVAAGLPRSSVLCLDRHVTLGYARQRGLEAIRTEFTMLLDADDELRPGRVERFRTLFTSSACDAIADEIELRDGLDGGHLKVIRMPSFLKTGRDLCRLFERNYLPGIGQIAFRTEKFREIGYDVGLTGPEDSDIVLRALLQGVKFHLVREVGYRMYHYPNSVSRNIDHQNRELQKALEKHDYREVEALFEKAGYSQRVMAWSLHGLAMFRGDWPKALEYLSKACPLGSDLEETLEPNGPEPVPEGWRVFFAKGVVAYMRGFFDEADRWWALCSHFGETAELANNRAVVMRKLGEGKRAEALFDRALQLSPGYYDARVNKDNLHAARITARPLRREPGRSRYA